MANPVLFPPVEHANPEGLLAIGGNLEIATLISAYSQGIFPWPHAEEPLLWFAPPQRAILDFKDFRVSRRLRQSLKNKNFYFKKNTQFTQVIKACAEGKTRKTKGTWILDEMISAYIRLHQAGYAESFECFNEAEELVGGLYGVRLGKSFAAESMFYHQSHASKAALIFAVQDLQKQGLSWMDVQVMSPLVASFGAKAIPREVFMKKLTKLIPA